MWLHESHEVLQETRSSMLDGPPCRHGQKRRKQIHREGASTSSDASLATVKDMDGR
jgi:hypothetical protein